MKIASEQSCWSPVKKIMGNQHILLGPLLSYQFANTPRRVLYSLSYYKFAAKLIGYGKKVIDIGCGEGLGTWLLAVECGQTEGIDFDQKNIEIAKKNWVKDNISFKCANFIKLTSKSYDAAVSIDVIEHILPKNTSKFFQKITNCLTDQGIAIIGTPNVSAEKYSSKITRAGHVNLYSGERLKKEMLRYFSSVFLFGANDEVVHTGFLPMSQYLIAVGCCKRK